MVNFVLPWLVPSGNSCWQKRISGMGLDRSAAPAAAASSSLMAALLSRCLPELLSHAGVVPLAHALRADGALLCVRIMLLLSYKQVSR